MNGIRSIVLLVSAIAAFSLGCREFEQAVIRHREVRFSAKNDMPMPSEPIECAEQAIPAPTQELCDAEMSQFSWQAHPINVEAQAQIMTIHADSVALVPRVCSDEDTPMLEAPGACVYAGSTKLLPPGEWRFMLILDGDPHSDCIGILTEMGVVDDFLTAWAGFTVDAIGCVFEPHLEPTEDGGHPE
jgi:hypothetical protein